MESIKEYRDLLILTRKLPRHQQQINNLFEADCEIVKINSKYYFTATTDSIGEEISMGLYTDPETWGWMTVISSVSDLAASGSSCVGLLVSSQWKFKTPKQVQLKTYKGIREALKTSKTCILGGDSGFAGDFVLTSTAFGTSSVKPLTRVGARPGDWIGIIGKKKTGIGPALAFSYLFSPSDRSKLEKEFRPSPSLQRMSTLRKYCSASIDTSDGIATSLNILGSLNKVGFDLDWREDLIHPLAKKLCRKLGFHELMLWMGDHGDFQTLVSIPNRHLAKAKKTVRDLVIIGRVTDEIGKTQVRFGETQIRLPIELVTRCPRDLESIKKLTLNVAGYFANTGCKN
ncbi:MAG: hypothetical protein A4S09_13795 [Proteobacteria bacterium SG_bin7]|nr:MAG: hypothetical protein A4S09_13795 [Proteobacteria bacterium SG_bin7]